MPAGRPEPLKIHQNHERVVPKRDTPLSEKTVDISQQICENDFPNDPETIRNQAKNIKAQLLQTSTNIFRKKTEKPGNFKPNYTLNLTLNHHPPSNSPTSSLRSSGLQPSTQPSLTLSSFFPESSPGSTISDFMYTLFSNDATMVLLYFTGSTCFKKQETNINKCK